jgi:hypothetical protein
VILPFPFVLWLLQVTTLLFGFWSSGQIDFWMPPGLYISILIMFYHTLAFAFAFDDVN